MSIRQKFTPNVVVMLLLAALALAYVFHAFQQVLGLTPQEEIAAVILVATAILWISEALPLYITSLGVLFASIIWLLPVLAQANIEAGKEDFLIAFFGDITLLFMGGFVLAALLNKYGISRMIARNIMERTGNDPARLLLAIILVSAVMSMWLSNTGTAALMFAIMAPVVVSLPETSPFPKALALAIPFACNLGGIGTPIGTPPNAIAMEYLSQVGIPVSFSMWMLLAVPLMLILLFVLWKILLRMYPPGDIQIDLKIEQLHHFGRRQWIVSGLFVLTVLGWLTGGLTGLSTGTVGLFVVLAAFGSRLLETQDFKNLSWDILFMLGGGLCLGTALRLSGITTTIAGLIPLEGQMAWILLLMLALAAVMTTFMSNTATANLLIPVAVSLPQGELLLAIAISLMCSSSMALPISTPPNAIAFGSGFITSRDMLGSGLIITVISLVGIMLAGIFYLPLIF